MRWKTASSEAVIITTPLTAAVSSSSRAKTEVDSEEEDAESYSLTTLIFPGADHVRINRLMSWVLHLVGLELGRIGVKY